MSVKKRTKKVWTAGAFTIVAIAFALTPMAFVQPVIGNTTAVFEFGDETSQPGSADIATDAVQAGADWGDMFDSSGFRLDRVDGFGAERRNFVADAIDGGGIDAALMSAGSGTAYLFAARGSDSQLMLYAGAENIASQTVEIELNQAGFGGGRAENDLVIQIGPGESGATISVSQVLSDGGLEEMASVSTGSCTADSKICALGNGSAIDGGAWSDAGSVAAGDFAEVAINVTELMGDDRLCYRSAQMRSGADTAAKGFYTCKGTAPEIWPERSGYQAGEAVRILGWNLAPDTDYEITVTALADGSTATNAVTTDDAGDLLGGPAAFTAADAAGMYEIKVQSNSGTGEPLARTAIKVVEN